MSEDRADKILLKIFTELTRSKVQMLIGKGKILYRKNEKWSPVSKPSQKVSSDNPDDWKVLEDEEMNYVSRGALKLKKALEEFQINVENFFCLDIGLSTGGFTDYLLQSGAEKVLGIDVGQGQLHDSLKSNKKLVWKDKVNARELLPEELLSDFFKDQSKNRFDLIVIDVSFISLDKIVPHLKNYINSDGRVVALVKPQFELSRSELNKKGVVKDQSLVAEVLKKMSRVFMENGLKVISECVSPIEGENGNKEVLILAESL